MSRSIPDTSARSKITLRSIERAARPVVLVIDPDASARSVLEVGLARDGFDVWSADSGPAGLRLLQGRAPDAIVLESDLGTEEGFSFVAQLRGDERLAQVPVLLLARPDDLNVTALAEVVGIDAAISKPAFARDVAALVRLELARRDVVGPVPLDAATLPPVQLLRALLSGPRAGRLVLVGGRAELRFRAGRVIDARLDGRGAALDTVVRALALTAGPYSLSLEAVDGFAEVHCGLREFVQVVMPRLQRWARVRQRSLPLDARLAVDFARLAKSLKALPDQINRVVQLFDGFRTVQDVLVDSAFDETTTLEVSTRLYLMGVLGPAKGEASELIFFPLPMPRLFEPRATEAEELMQRLFDGTAEIRAEAADEDDDADWYTLSAGDTGLEVPEPDGGWTTAPVPSALTAGLSPDLARHLDAFHTPMRVEAPEPREGEREARHFASGHGEPPQPGLEGMVRQAAEQAPLEPAALDAHRAAATDRQARIETPWMTPVVTAEAFAEVRAESAPSVVVEPALARAQTPVLTPAVAGDPEARFFAEAATLDVPELDAPVAAPPQRSRWPFVVAAAVLLLLMAGFEALRAAPAPAVPVIAAPVPVVVPDLEPPEFYAVVDELEFVDEAPAVPVDVAAPLEDARRLYEAGRYPQAIALLEQVVIDEPASVSGWLLLGLARYDFHDSVGAREAADQVQALDPKNARVQVLLATLHFDANDRAAGKAALERYLELEPKGAHVEEAKALLRR